MALLLRLRSNGVEEKRLLEAVEKTPRDRFVPTKYISKPYSMRSCPMECGQTMTGADQVIRSVHALDVSPQHSVLEIGTGTGYQAALIARMAKKVVTLDRFRRLVENATRRFELLGIENIVARQADGGGALAEPQLYDRIIVNGVFSNLPKQYLDHLSSGGIMITAIGEPVGEQMLVRLTKIGSRFDRQDLFAVRMAPLRSGIAEYL